MRIFPAISEITKNAVSDVASLTGKDSNDISKVIHCASYVKFNEDGSSEIVTDKEADKLWGQAELLTGGNAIHELLVRLNLPDHPERMAFKVLPVLPTAYRPLGIIEGCWKYGASDLNDAYRFVLQRVTRVNYSRLKSRASNSPMRRTVAVDSRKLHTDLVLSTCAVRNLRGLAA